MPIGRLALKVPLVEPWKSSLASLVATKERGYSSHVFALVKTAINTNAASSENS